ncbi:ABC transporter substrate-binding protein [Roseiflexus castenholzii]|uniref:ABC transporter substrate-binding protein n=1 Tax=Roseiflexus castenholzii TaxID=120962 RepID=UPI003C7A82F1
MNQIHCFRPLELTEAEFELFESLTRRRFLIGAGALVLAGCGVPGASAPTATVAATQMYKHVAGETEIPAKPERIVALSTYAWAWPITQLGGSLIGTDNSPEFIEALNELDPENAARIAEATFIGGESGPNLETIASLNPDLIVGGWWNTDIYDTLSQIAPTVILDYRNETDIIAWQRSLIPLVGATDTSWFDTRVADYERRIGMLKAAYPDLWPTLEWVRMDAYETDVYVVDTIPFMPARKVLSDLGAQQSKTMGDTNAPRFEGAISLDLLPQFDADVIFLCENKDQPNSDVASILGGTFAGTRGQVFTTPSTKWNFCNVQSLHTALDEIERLLSGRTIDTSGDFR